MGVHLINVFIDKHRILCLQKMAFATQASNIDLLRLASLLAFESTD
jgi:hypothetical protein